MKDWTEKELIAKGYTIRNAIITDVDLSTVNYCCADLRLTIDGGGWGCVYGGYKLGHGGTYIKREEIQGSEDGMAAILNIMWTLNSDSLFDLKNKHVRVATKGWGETIKIIGNIIEDKWFDYGTFFEDKEE